jgi:uncharacterized protein YehS (DUF1456 family)
MERTKEIFKRYEQADFFERMCLFLQFSDLRDIFQEIEFNDSSPERSAPASIEQHKGYHTDGSQAEIRPD